MEALTCVVLFTITLFLFVVSLENQWVLAAPIFFMVGIIIGCFMKYFLDNRWKY